MREIKFRAWDSADKKMVDINLLHFPETGTPYPIWGDPKDNVGIARYKLMQFTGLKDKNGKEIYEGDIIRYWAGGAVYVNTPVTFSEGTFAVEYAPRANLLDRDMEVIGNIYENPELLK